MLKRPKLRVRVSPCVNTDPPLPGTFLHNIMYSASGVKRPYRPRVYRHQNVGDYLKMLERNYDYWGVPYKKPDITEIPIPKKQDIKIPEPDIDFNDKIYTRLTVLKSGIVRIKIIPHLLILWESYYSKGKRPPFKNIVAAYKAVGFSEEFLTKMNEKKKKNIIYCKKLDKIIDLIFDKKAAPKKKLIKKVIEKKAEPVDATEDLIENEEKDEKDEKDENDDDGPEEDEAIVVDDDDDEVEKVGEFDEEYVDDD